jgi:hypothetical protein
MLGAGLVGSAHGSDAGGLLPQGVDRDRSYAKNANES